ncbi:MAG: cell division ATP-binding protein FtsE, partial [Pseudolysinimonas sp.]
LADEPTGNLDPATSAGIMQLLSTINANGTTVLMATHDSGIVDQMKRRVIELVSGQVVRDERSGGYQTQAVPVQNFNLTGSLVAESLAAAQPPSRVVAAPAPTEQPRESMVPAPATTPAPATIPSLATAPEPAAQVPRREAAEAASPPPLNEPGRRA